MIIILLLHKAVAVDYFVWKLPHGLTTKSNTQIFVRYTLALACGGRAPSGFGRPPFLSGIK